MRGLAPLVLVLAGCTSGSGPTTAPARTESPPEPAVVEGPAGRAWDAERSGGDAAAAAATAPASAATRGPLAPVTVICERALRCGTIGRSQLDECRKGEGQSRLTLVWGNRGLLGLDGLVAAGRLAIQEEESLACLEFLSVAPCRYNPASAPAKCFGGGVVAYAPRVPPGGRCERWDECAGGFCTAQPGCAGVCVAYAPLGGPCGSNQLCEEGTFCWDGECRRRAEVGEVCAGHWQWCKDGLICDGYWPRSEGEEHYTPERPGRCSAGKKLGEGCVPPQTASGEVCEVPLYCDWSEASPVCRAPLPEGAECRWLDSCADGLVCAGLVLGGRHPSGVRYGVQTPGRCVRPLDAGDACEPGAFVSGCPASMVCDPRSKVCRSTGHAGDPCESSWVTKPVPEDRPLRNEGCFSGHYCDMQTRTCVRQLGRGARCKPQPFGVEDEPCFLGHCDAKTRRCASRCERR